MKGRREEKEIRRKILCELVKEASEGTKRKGKGKKGE